VGLFVTELFDTAFWKDGNQLSLVVEFHHGELATATAAVLVAHEVLYVSGAIRGYAFVLLGALSWIACSVVVDEVVNDSLGAIDKTCLHIDIPL
jgi:hypothetical protein